MILYNVTVSVSPEVNDDWLQWMKAVHIPEVLATGLFVENRLMRLLSTEAEEIHTYAVQYFLRSLEDYQRYQREFAPALQKKHLERYGDRCLAFRTLLETVE